MASRTPSPSPDAAAASEVARRLARWGEDRAWRGTDPYEGLSTSRRLVAPLKHTPLGRRVLIQAVKRSPVDLRGALGIEPKPDAASLAWAVSAYARNGFLDPDEARARLSTAIGLLEGLRCGAFEEPCWGYHFDFQSRVFFYRSGEPNTIATAFAGHALLDAHEALDDPDLLDRAHGVGRFFMRHVPLTEDGEGAYFGYLPGDRSPIHNSSLLAASLLARLAARGRDAEEFSAAAAAAVRYSAIRQRPDGSWPYGELPNLSWVDNFHTGYVLDALRTCADCEVGAARGGRGVDEGDRLLRPADVPRRWRAQVLLEQAPPDRRTIDRAGNSDAVDRRAPRRLARVGAVDGVRFRAPPDDRRRRDPALPAPRLWTNPAPHVRWVVAPMLLALTHLLAARGRRHSRGPRAGADGRLRCPEHRQALPAMRPTAPPRRPPGSRRGGSRS